MLHALTLIAAACAPADDVALPVGQTLRGELAAGDTHSYVLQAEADTFVRGRVDQLGVDVVVRLVGPDGAQLAEIDGPARGPELFALETDDAGTYRVEVRPFEDETGAYSITLSHLEPVATEPDALVDQLLAPYDQPDMPGAVVSVWRDGETLFRKAYGMANLTYDIPYSVDTRCNIGSTSKQFTAMAVLLLAEQGLLDLDDDVREHIPELPDLGATVTVRHLLTHTSGYREFLNFLGMTGRRSDRGDFIDRGEILDIVRRQPALQNEPGAEWNYNNTAYGLAAVLVERLTDQDFPDAMRALVFEPLGMRDTMVRASQGHIVPDRAEGYVPDEGGWLELGDLGGAVGAGGMYTTVADLQRWIENYADPVVGTPDMVEQMTTAFELNDGTATNYGLGLFLDEQRGLRRVHHGGGDVAHRSQLVWFPEINAGLTTQSNHAGFDGGIAFRLAEAFFGDEMEPEIVAAAEEGSDVVAVAESVFDIDAFEAHVGRYALDVMPGFVLTLARDGDRATVQGTGQPAVELEPTSATTFELVGVDAALTLHPDEDGHVATLTLHQGGDNRATRLDESAEPVALTDFAGRYFSAEAETFYDLRVEEDELIAYQRRLGDMVMRHGSGDDFSTDRSQVEFERDRHGAVIGFYLSNGRTRDVRFERVGS